MKEFVIGRNDCSQRADKFIAKAVPGLPKGLMQKYLRIKRIKLNGKRCEPSVMLCEGDVLTMYINDEFFPANCGGDFRFSRVLPRPKVIFEDENLIIMDKPVNLPCHSGNKKECDTLVDRLVSYLIEKKEFEPEKENTFVPALCNRIDRNTCGLVIGAKNAMTLRCVNEAIRNGEVKKEYLCAVVGKMPKDSDILHAFLSKKRGGENLVSVCDKPFEGSKEIITEYSVLRENNGISLLSVTLHTGRTHQIRAHLAHIGCGVLGDVKYGRATAANGVNAPYHALCSHKIKFCFNKQSPLFYLNSRDFVSSEPWFIPAFFK